MHILVINDDGPPSTQSSPYVHSLVLGLQDAGHAVSVVLPHTQRSWIGKAHMVGQTVKPTYFRPGTLHQDDGTTHPTPLLSGSGSGSGSESSEEWMLLDGTPASCAQIGIHHYRRDRGPVDLVVSGPNYGRNTTAVFGLSSGTLGGALEAAVCGKKAIALSYAFFSRNHDPDIIAGASRLSVKVIEYLSAHFGPDVDVYSVNVPLVPEVEHHKILYTQMLQNYWSTGSSFQEVDPVQDRPDAEKHEREIREEKVPEGGAPRETAHVTHKHFKWAPNFSDVYQSVETSAPGNDGWAVKNGYTSVTPLKANFMHASGLEGELKLRDETAGVKATLQPKMHLHVRYDDAYVQPMIMSALERGLAPSSYTHVRGIEALPSPSTPFLQYSSYETLPFEHLLAHPSSSLANAYIIRKALIRKHFLASTIHAWITKHPASLLPNHVKPAVQFELDYAEFLDDALVEAFELHQAFQRNAERKAVEREWWILKPSMSDRGQGIRLFSSEDEL
ncbi:MAG: hypothetical protein M1838_003199, partial [Thelocarpon superellum]